MAAALPGPRLESSESYVERLHEAKVLGALCSAVLAGLGCWLARRLEQARARGSSNREALLMAGNTMAAGILLAAALVHMLPDALKALEDVSTFPLASAIAGGAFCFLVVLGEVAGGCMPERDEPHSQTDCVAYKASFALWPRMELMPPHGCEDAACEEAPPEAPAGAAAAAPPRRAGGDSPLCTVIPELAPEGGHGPCRGHAHVHEDAYVHPPKPDAAQGLALAQALLADAASGLQGHSCHSHSACCRVHRHSDAPCTTQALPACSPCSTPRLSPSTPLDGAAEPLLGHPQTHPEDKTVLCPVSRCHVRVLGGGPIAEAKSFLLFFALSFHSVMEGIGLGSATDAGLLTSVLVAVLAHKGLAAFALGCSLTQSDLPAWKFWTFVVIFSVGTPLGCALGAVSTDLDDDATRSITSGVCIALASGTFLQVSSMELLPRAFAEERHKATGGCGLVFGFVAMSLLAIWC